MAFGCLLEVRLSRFLVLVFVVAAALPSKAWADAQIIGPGRFPRLTTDNTGRLHLSTGWFGDDRGLRLRGERLAGVPALRAGTHRPLGRGPTARST